jgi:hypothetical protein
MVGPMIAKGDIEEVHADLRKGEPVWRETGDGHGATLVATYVGLAAIGIERDEPYAAPVGATDAPSDAPAKDNSHQARNRAQGAHASRGHKIIQVDRHAASTGGRDHRGNHGGFGHSRR